MADYGERRSALLTVRLQPRIKLELRQLARDLGVSMADLIEDLLDWYFEARKEQERGAA